MQAHHDKLQSLKNIYTMQSRIVKLQRHEEKMLNKIENERKKADEWLLVRKNYEEQVRVLKMKQLEKERAVVE